MEFVIQHLAKSFEKKEVLRDIDFRFESGKIYGLLGRNGAGKTTLFNCLNRDIKCDGGSFWLEEEGRRRELQPDDIGYVLSAPVVPEFLTGREFLKFFMDINAPSIGEPGTPDEYFDYMSIAPEDRDKLMKDYSHGMKNKMQMLINIIAKPNVLLLDEPLTSLDVVVAEEMKQLLRSLEAGPGDDILHPYNGPGPGPLRRDSAAQPGRAGGGGQGGAGRGRLQGEDNRRAQRGRP